MKNFYVKKSEPAQPPYQGCRYAVRIPCEREPSLSMTMTSLRKIELSASIALSLKDRVLVSS